jgi:hypothetical protein
MVSSRMLSFYFKLGRIILMYVFWQMREMHGVLMVCCVQVVAAEMKEELGLTLPTEKLSSLIRLQVESVGGGSGSGSGVLGETSSQKSETTDCVSVAVLNPIGATSSASSNVVELAAPPNSVDRSSNEQIGTDAPSSAEEGAAVIPAMQLSHGVGIPGGSLDEGAGHLGATKEESAGGPLDEPTPLKASNSADLEQSGERDVVQLSNTSSLVSMDIGAVTSSLALDDAVCAVQPPGEDASPEEIMDYQEYLKENEKIDKESRAAKRVFEQRIQKHKIIQVR